MDKGQHLIAIEKFKEALQTANIEVEKLILFGSHAAGIAREDSDIDVIVISSDFEGKSYWERVDILSDAIYEVMAPIEAAAFTPQEWASGKSLLVDFAKDGMAIA